MPLAPAFALACALLVMGGFGSAAFANMQTSLIVLHAPPHIRSRLMGLLTVCIGMGPLGILLIGVLADRVGPMFAVDIMALAGLVAVSAIGLVWRQNDLRRRLGTGKPGWTRTDRCSRWIAPCAKLSAKTSSNQCHPMGEPRPCKTSA